MATARKRKWGSGEAYEATWMEGGKRYRKGGFATKREVEDFLTEKRKDIKDGVSRPAAHKITLAALCVEFDQHLRDRLDRNSIVKAYYVGRRGHINNYIAQDCLPRNANPKIGSTPRPFSSSIGHLLLSQIRPATCEKFKDDLLGATALDHLTVRGILGTLHSVLQFGMKREYLATNPAADIKVEAPRTERTQRVTPPSPATVQAVIAEASGMFKLAVCFSASAGLRASELRALRYRHVNVSTRMVEVETRVDAYYSDDGTVKSKAGYRSIPLSKSLLAALAHHRAEATFDGDDDLVFANEKGYYLSQKYLLEKLNHLTAKLRELRDDGSTPIPSRFTWHALRHFAISSWIAAGFYPKAVQTFAGHADIATTMNRYGHLFPSDSHWEKMDEASDIIFGDGASAGRKNGATAGAGVANPSESAW